MKQVKNKAKLECGVAGFFHIKQLDKDGNLKFESEFKNLIVDQGLDAIATNANVPFDYCLLLTDNTPPTTSETHLDVDWGYRSNSKSGNETGVGVAPNWDCYRRATYTFEASTESRNVSSVAIGYYNGNVQSRRLFSRALILDSEGDPTTLSILEGDRVLVTYELRHYPPVNDVTGSITLSGNIGGTYNYIIRPALLGSLTANHLGRGTSPTMAELTVGVNANTTACYTGDLGPVDGLPSGTANEAGGAATVTVAPYVDGSFSSQITWNRGLAKNPIPIRCAIHKIGPFTYQTQFDPPIPKTTEDVLELTYAVSWARR